MKRVGQFAAVLAAVASFFAWVSEGLAAEPIRIGYMATLTGEGATWGQHEREGALMAVKDINADIKRHFYRVYQEQGIEGLEQMVGRG